MELENALTEIAMLAEEVAFWRFQAIEARAMLLAVHCGRPPMMVTETDRKSAKIDLEYARIKENQERRGYVEPAHNIGS